MPVFPSATPLLQDRQELHRFLLEFQNYGLQDYQTKILSIAHEIQWIDPLAILQQSASILRFRPGGCAASTQ